MTIRALTAGEISCEMFSRFIRRQVVTKCLRKQNGEWREVDAPFIDDWTEADRADRIGKIRQTALDGGAVFGAFEDGWLKGFATVEPKPLGSRGQYLDLSRIHVSADARGRGMGRALFAEAKRWASERGAGKLYISAHSAVESQAFYRAMGCVEAQEYDPAHVADEPCDCQLECALCPPDGAGAPL